MFVVEVELSPLSPTQRCISGIFLDRNRAIEFMASHTPPCRPSLKTPSVRFPFYIIEEPRHQGNCFRYTNMQQTIRVIREIIRTNDEEHTYLNIFYVGGEFCAKTPDSDEMHRLGEHGPRRINNEWLRTYDRVGDVMIAEMR
jgi:hypothetical protein